MSAADVQALLRFLSQDAKVPLATAMAKIRDMQAAKLDSIEAISKVKIDQIIAIFGPDEKLAKQILNAAKRINKKRSAGDVVASSPAKRKRKDPFEVQDALSPADVERSLDSGIAQVSEEELEGKVYITNRAPLVLAFASTLTKFTMPEQPPSSRLSLAQAVVSLGSQSKAKYIGLKSGPTAEDEGWGKGQPTVTVMGRKISVLKRWNYDWKADPVKVEGDVKTEIELQHADYSQDISPALWAIDLDKLKDLNGPVTFSVTASSGTAGLPVYSPQSARDYMYRSFDTAPSSTPDIKSEDVKPDKKKTGAEAAAERHQNVGCLLQALEMLFGSWSKVLSAEDLDKRAWGWYVAVRPDVEHGVAGWGAKGELKLKDILDLRRKVS